MSRKSSATAKSYLSALKNYNEFLQPKGYDIETIVPALLTKKVDVYLILDEFVGYLEPRISAASVSSWVAGVRSYLGYADVDIISNKFKHRVHLPSIRKEDEKAIDGKDIRQILLACDSLKMKAYLLFLASSGARAVEALAVRYKDLDPGSKPTKIYMQAKYAKNKLPREVYISDEATGYLMQWLDHKYEKSSPNPEDRIFAVIGNPEPESMYPNIVTEFVTIRKRAGFSARKISDKNNARHEVTLHSFRRYVQTAVEDATSLSYADYTLGHKKSVYYTKKEPQRKEMFRKCMKYLTYLDYNMLESSARTIEAKLEEKDDEIETLKQDVKLLKEIYGDPALMTMLANLRKEPGIS